MKKWSGKVKKRNLIEFEPYFLLKISVFWKT